MSLTPVSPAQAQQKIARGALLVDIRAADEFARERIPAARNIEPAALGMFDPAGQPVIFHCLSGNRTRMNAPQLLAAVPGAMVLEGGIQAWKAAGLPVAVDRRQPLEVQRQVQIAAGSLVLAGMGLGTLVSPAFYGLAAFVGAGLVFAGVSGWCGMATACTAMPWNRTAP